MRRRRAYERGIIVVTGCLLLAGAPAVRAEPAIASEDRAEVERRVEEIERQFRALRDQQLARCRGAWTLCTNKRCKKIQLAEATRWQACQDACDTDYERCKGAAYEFWPEGS